MIRKLPDQINLPASVNRLQVSHLLVILNITRQTLCNWRKNEKNPFPNSFRSEGQHFIMMDDLEKWLCDQGLKIKKV